MDPENTNNPSFTPGSAENRLNALSTLLFYFFILAFILGFNFSDYRAGSWYQQFMPNLNGASITDIIFTDSLNGYAVTSLRSGNDSAYVLKTTNGGDNWSIKYTNNRAFVRIEFINSNTGFTNAYTKIFKTTDAGNNWTIINLPSIFGDDMFVLNENTIWLAMSESLTGGVYRTTNGGGSWTNQLSLGNLNPEKIYMYNSRIGYVCKTGGSQYIRKTTDSGASWNVIVNGDYFAEMYFADSLTGWKCSVFGMKKTTDGGLNWITQTLPFGGIISVTGILSFSNVNRDTIFGVGGYVIYPNNQVRGMIYRTTNGGNNWLFQIPDTSIHIGQYNHIQFINGKQGWAYRNSPTGIHTTTGGNDTFLTGIKQISSNMPAEYELYQNYPNPFNPQTIIKYQIVNNKYQKKANIILKIFDIAGREVITLVNEEQSAGTYAVDFSGTGYSSGVYFYSLIIDEVSVDTKKMVLIK